MMAKARCETCNYAPAVAAWKGLRMCAECIAAACYYDGLPHKVRRQDHDIAARGWVK